ncbi:MAG: hypothetical protein WCN88_04850 [Candidatus Falkowbacteria bacterium]
MNELKRQECIVYSRVCGWLTPKSSGNPGKQAEYADRKTYDVQLEQQYNV